MPQKAKFTKEEIIQAALLMTEEEGIERLTARSLGERLHSSARPIFTTFRNMEEVLDGVQKSAYAIYQSYVEEGLKANPAFKGVGTAYIRFASEHPKLFQLLFMQEQKKVPGPDEVLGQVDGSYEKIMRSITDTYPVSEEFAKKLYLHLWIYSHGIAVLITTKMCRFSADEISNMLTDIFKGLITEGLKK